MQLIQLSSITSITPKGMYLVPTTVSMDEFETQVKAFDKSADPQNDFDELNTIGAQRIYSYDCMLDLNNF